jgi:hypothetical protein
LGDLVDPSSHQQPMEHYCYAHRVPLDFGRYYGCQPRYTDGMVSRPRTPGSENSRLSLAGRITSHKPSYLCREYFFVNGILPKLAQKLTVVAPKAESIDEIPSKSVDE